LITDTLKNKLAKIKSGQYTPQDFIIADAKDGDMAFGVAAPGPVNSGELVSKSGAALRPIICRP